METLKGLVANLAFILLLATFLEMLLPNTSMRGFVRLVMGFFVIAAVLQPVTGLLKIPLDDILHAWTGGGDQTSAQAPDVLPEGQSGNPGKDAVREQYRKILRLQIQKVAESVPLVERAEAMVEFGSEGEGYLDYPPILKVKVDIYKPASGIELVEGVETVVIGGEESAEPRTKPVTLLEKTVGDRVCEALQVSRDSIVVYEH
ncbi:MAG: stage III sporulation protein AF [Peptococcaceae bacterium]|nr:stage III sporulation protein AF [Peptococcaceae bacterium]